MRANQTKSSYCFISRKLLSTQNRDHCSWTLDSWLRSMMEAWSWQATILWFLLWEAFLRPHIDEPRSQLDKALPLCARGPKSEPQHQIPINHPNPGSSHYQSSQPRRSSIISTQEVHTITPTQEVHTINHPNPRGRGKRIRSVTPLDILQV